MRPLRPEHRRARRAAKRRTRRARAGKPPARRLPVLAALTSSALALPGVAGSARADTPVDRWALDFSSTYYAEGDIDEDKVSAGDTSRYEIFTQQLRLTAPVTDRSELTLDFVHETMSGATPWFVEPDANGDPVQVMTGASVEEERIDALVSGSYFFDKSRFTLSGGVSDENDYFAINGGFEYETHFNEKNTTLTTGAGFSVDQIEPTDAGTLSFPTRPEDEEKQTYSTFLTLSQILGRNTALQSTLSYQYGTGFLSDPYKLVSVMGANRGDKRPDTRNQLAWLTRLRHHFGRANATLHADYQLYLDDWGINAHTLELAWYQTLWDRLRLIPSVRYYSQSQADFYAPYFLFWPSDGLFSSDYRLSPYGALSGKIRAESVPWEGPWRTSWRLAFIYEHYMSSADFALGSVEVENPGLVDFNVFTVNLSARF